jgi:CRISPR-associated endonuclease/helicase Cas3
MADRLAAERFPEFFETVRGFEPFPWQDDLVTRIIEGDWPDVVDVPTGLGKTSIIDVWAFALAVHAQRDRRAVPLRLNFVVDRRLVVDGAYESAFSLVEALKGADDGLIAEVAGHLGSLSGGAADPLTVVRMRGGVTWESRWLARPDQAAVIVGTVDQFGSRLLFRGYGVSPSMRPIDAALVSVDSWLVVDEAHISEPLLRTVDTVAAHQVRSGWQPTDRALRVTRMSATVDAKGAVFRADLDAQMSSERFPLAAAEAEKRLRTSKPIVLVDLAWLDKRATRKTWRAKSAQLGEAMAEIALGADPEARVVAVVTNTIASARAAHNRLLAKGAQAILMIGRVRGYERDRLIEEWLDRLRVGSRRAFEGRLYVVATQTIEVGADLDFDLLVTECAPLSSLVQRFGRVNRVGDRGTHHSFIVHAGFAHSDDPVYGAATPATWEYLQVTGARPVTIKTKTKVATAYRADPDLDFGLLTLGNLPEPPHTVTPDSPFVPIALGSHFERWAATNPAPMPDQVVGPFLHGVGHSVPEVSVAWRAAPPGDAANAEMWNEWLDLAPPVEWEFVSVPIWEARALLTGDPSTTPTADLEGVLVPDEAETGEAGDEALGVVYEGRRSLPRLVRGPSDIKLGDRLVLRSDVGGHDEWGWTGRRRELDDPQVWDIGDFAPTRRSGVRRVTDGILRTWGWDPSEGDPLVTALRAADPEEPETIDAVFEAIESSSLPGHLSEVLADSRGWKAVVIDSGGVLMVEGSSSRFAADARSDEDPGSTSLSTEPATLADHGAAVGEMARCFARSLGFDDEVVRAVELAGRWHDLGKSDPRFQVMLYGGDSLAAAVGPAMAKSGRDPRDPIFRKGRELAKLPWSFRHEAVSERLVFALLEERPELVDGLDVDLILHLVVSHHGKGGRPLLPPLDDQKAPETELDVEGTAIRVLGRLRQVDWSHPARFERLCDLYGWWGLAYLETIVRLADMLCSEEGR